MKTETKRLFLFRLVIEVHQDNVLNEIEAQEYMEE